MSGLFRFRVGMFKAVLIASICSSAGVGRVSSARMTSQFTAAAQGSVRVF